MCKKAKLPELFAFRGVHKFSAENLSSPRALRPAEPPLKAKSSGSL